MRECLNDPSTLVNSIHLQPTRAYQYCAYSMERLPEGQPAISVQDDKYLVWLSIGAIDDLAACLTRFKPRTDPQEVEHNVKERVEGNLTYMSSRCGECVVCGERVGYGNPVFSLKNPKGTPTGSSKKVCFHEHCAEGFVASLDRVWDHADDLIADFI